MASDGPTWFEVLLAFGVSLWGVELFSEHKAIKMANTGCHKLLCMHRLRVPLSVGNVMFEEKCWIPGRLRVLHGCGRCPW